MTGLDRPSTNEDPAAALVFDFAETARVLFAAGSLEETLTQVVGLAIHIVDACEFAGIFLLERDGAVDVASTHRLVGELDALQRRLGEGPSLDAVEHGLTFYADELGEDQRWSDFGPAAATQGVRSVFALPVRGEATLGALTLYAGYPQAFGVIDRAKALLLAALAGIATSAARSHDDEASRADNLHAALVTRELIGQAQGILIERERITADQAFAILRQASQHLNVKLREVAHNLVETGERPDTGQHASS
jgi:hypothetical protein